MEFNHSEFLGIDDDPSCAHLPSAEIDTECGTSEQQAIEYDSTNIDLATVRQYNENQLEDPPLPIYKSNNLEMLEESNDESSERSYSLLTTHGLENITELNESTRINSQLEDMQPKNCNSQEIIIDHLERVHCHTENHEIRNDSRLKIGLIQPAVLINAKESQSYPDSTSGWFLCKKPTTTPKDGTQVPSHLDHAPVTFQDSDNIIIDSYGSQVIDILTLESASSSTTKARKSSFETTEGQIVDMSETIAESVSASLLNTSCKKPADEKYNVLDNVPKLKENDKAADLRTSEDYTVPSNYHNSNTVVFVTAPICVEPFLKMPRLDSQDLKSSILCHNENYKTSLKGQNNAITIPAEPKATMLENQNPPVTILLDSQNSDDANEMKNSIPNQHVSNTSWISNAEIYNTAPNIVTYKANKQNPTQLTLHKYMTCSQPSRGKEQHNIPTKKTEALSQKALTTKIKFKNLKQLLLLGIIEPGVDVLSTFQMGTKREASLLVDGSLVSKGKVQPSLSSWFRSVGGEKRPKLSTLSTEIMYKGMPLCLWIAQHEKRYHASTQGKSNDRSKRMHQIKCSFATELPKPDVENLTSFVSSSVLIPVRQSVLTISSSTPILHNPKPLSSSTNWNPSHSSAQPIKSLPSLALHLPTQCQPTLNRSPHSNLIGWDSLTNVRLISNEELFKFSQIEWDNFLDDHNTLESLESWD